MKVKQRPLQIRESLKQWIHTKEIVKEEQVL